MEAISISKNSWIARATQWKPSYVSERKSFRHLQSTCDVLGALTRSVGLIILTFFLYFNLAIFSVGVVGDVAISIHQGYPNLALLENSDGKNPFGDGEIKPAMMYIGNEALSMLGVTDAEKPLHLGAILALAIPALLLTLVYPLLVVLILIGLGAHYSKVGYSILTDRFHDKQYMKYVQTCQKRGVTAQDRDVWEKMGRPKMYDPDEKTPIGIVIDLVVGAFDKVCKPILWKE